MTVQSDLDQLRIFVQHDQLSNLSVEDLERYSNALCFGLASTYFGGPQFTQVSETIRILLLKRYFSSLLVDLSRQADESAKVSIKLTDETRKLTKRLLYLTWAIAIFTIIMVFQNFIEFPKYHIFGAQKANKTIQYVEQGKNLKQANQAIPTIKK